MELVQECWRSNHFSPQFVIFVGKPRCRLDDATPRSRPTTIRYLPSQPIASIRLPLYPWIKLDRFMKYAFLLFLLLSNGFALQAQDEKASSIPDRYTLVEDKIFARVSDLYGYTFVPSEGKMRTAHYPNPIEPGVVSFTISRSDVIVNERAKYTPAGIDGVLEDAKPYRLIIARINNENSYEDNGAINYDLRLVDLQNQDLEGYLKIYIDAYSQVDMIKYRPSMADPEHIYWLPHITPEQDAADNAYFTHQEDFDTKALDEFWEKVIYPFVSYENQSNIGQRKISRIYPEDKVDVRFTETVLEKGKKEKILQHITFNNKDGSSQKLLVKKIREVEHVDHDAPRPRTVLEVEVKDELSQETYFVLFHRGAKKYMRAIELQEDKTRRSLLYYEMRRGKSKVPGQDGPPTAANPEANNAEE